MIPSSTNATLQTPFRAITCNSNVTYRPVLTLASLAEMRKLDSSIKKTRAKRFDLQWGTT
jgi:hypothetical protein